MGASSNLENPKHEYEQKFGKKHGQKQARRQSQKQLHKQENKQNQKIEQGKEQDQEQPKNPNEIDVNLIPYQNVKNKEVYLLKLVSKKLLITDNHISDGIKPTDEDNMIMTRLNIEIAEQMKKVFHDDKAKKKLKIRLTPDSHGYKFDELQKQLEIADWQWEDLNGEHEEYKKLMKEKKKQDDLIKLRGLHRQDLFYPDEEDDLYTIDKTHNEPNNNINNNFFQNQENEEEDEEN